MPQYQDRKKQPKPERDGSLTEQANDLLESNAVGGVYRPLPEPPKPRGPVKEGTRTRVQSIPGPANDPSSDQYAGDAGDAVYRKYGHPYQDLLKGDKQTAVFNKGKRKNRQVKDVAGMTDFINRNKKPAGPEY